MEERDIIKALECCVNGEDCLNCPLQEQFADCKPMTGALDLINRQKAEIERLKAHLEELADEVEDKMTYMCGCKNCIETVKHIIKNDVTPFGMFCDNCNRCKHRETEAIKEFAEMVKKQIDVGLRCGGVNALYLDEDIPKVIDNLVKEMVGAESG